MGIIRTFVRQTNKNTTTMNYDSTFKKGDRVKKGDNYGTVVYDSYKFNCKNYETVSVLWDGKRYDCARWGNIKGIEIVESK